MTDREMLELAAKAAGYYFHGLRIGFNYENCFVSTTNDTDDWIIWDPITDDGDALRLAVKLKIHVQPDGRYTWASTFKVNATEEVGANPYAATRRAIVRAAAEIGRQMEDTSNG